MDQAEASGKTVEDALNRALAILGARRDEVEFTVLDEGAKGGLFKRGRDAVVRVDRIIGSEAAPAAPREAPDTRIPHGQQARGGGAPRGKGRDRGGDRDRNRPASADRPAGDRPPRDRDRDRGGDRGGRERGGRGARPGLEVATPKLTEQDFLRPRGDAPATPPPADAGDGGAPRGRRGGRDRDRDRGGDRPAPSQGSSRPRPERRESRESEPEQQIAPDINAEEVDFAAQTVDDILRLLDIDASLTIREPLTPGDGLGMALAVIDISGEDLGLLIGRRGDTLLSLQYVVNLIVSRRYPGKGGVTIDVEHYRHRREEQVVSLAQRMADRVREHGSPITLEPMSAAERRLVHLALAGDPELETNSVGEGENRKVVISHR